MKKNAKFELREIAGEFMLINPESDMIDFTKVYSLNETAAFLWKKIENKNSFTYEDLKNFILGEYEIKDEDIENDIQQIISYWLQENIIIE